MLGDARLLLLEPDPVAAERMQATLEASGSIQVTVAASLRDAGALLRRTRVDVIVTELRLDDADGPEVVRRLRSCAPLPPLAVLTAHGSEDVAVTAIRLGADQYLPKRGPYRRTAERVVQELLGESLLRRVDRDRRPQVSPGRETGLGPDVIASSREMAEVLRLVRRAASSRVTVLIEGETGTGKEVVARAIHGLSDRSAPFRVQSCAAVSEHLLEAELFGHVRGAFTGAERDRAGLFLDARDGTVFLDEIGDAPPSVQATLLRVIQHREVKAVGADRPTRTRARILAATNRPLEREVAAGRFRSDLYYRLNVFPIRLPALRHRPEDIAVLLDHFLARFERVEGRRTGGFTLAARMALERHRWPGNVRELEHEVHRLVLTMPEEVPITVHDLAPRIRAADPPSRGEPLDVILRRVELAVLRDRVRRAPSKAAAARSLGITREALYWKLRRLEAGEADTPGNAPSAGRSRRRGADSP